jgi:hypothetical protein
VKIGNVLWFSTLERDPLVLHIIASASFPSPSHFGKNLVLGNNLIRYRFLPWVEMTGSRVEMAGMGGRNDTIQGLFNSSSVAVYGACAIKLFNSYKDI